MLVASSWSTPISSWRSQKGRTASTCRVLLPSRTRSRLAIVPDWSRFLIGKSVHSVGEAIAAAADGADYLLLGPVFAPISKPSGTEPIGLSALAEAVAKVRGSDFCAGRNGCESRARGSRNGSDRDRGDQLGSPVPGVRDKRDILDNVDGVDGVDSDRRMQSPYQFTVSTLSTVSTRSTYLLMLTVLTRWTIRSERGSAPTPQRASQPRTST